MIIVNNSSYDWDAICKSCDYRLQLIMHLILYRHAMLVQAKRTQDTHHNADTPKDCQYNAYAVTLSFK